ncbi:universal stress protein [Natrononativus amylolyticus]|uniref:universal stress protein n=1 Tax=Natrononativus amylolyticus TaxID=2963434 RepID=UPI0020CE9A46|nr:universal stress protein [Natrononativus amylolyticus]
MSENDGHRVLIPVEILRGQTIPDAVIETFASVPVVLLGYHKIPEQTAPSQARLQFEEKAQTELAELEAVFEETGGDITTRLVFTHKPMKTFERIAVELDCDSILLLNPAPRLERVLVPIRGDVNIEHIGRLVGRVMAGTHAEVTLLHVAPEDDLRQSGTELLESAGQVLQNTGVPEPWIGKEVVVDDDPLEVILEAADDHDMVVLGEDRPSVQDLIFGDTSERVAESAVCPVLVVRRRYLEPETET